jgi:hypothetical protein
MSPRTALLLLMAIGAGACNRQASAPASSVLETGVAATLTAAPPLPATRTAPPSATPSLTHTATVTLAPSLTSTGTVGPSPTLTPIPLPTDDPRFGLGLNLSAPHYHDGFAARFTWGEPVAEGVANIWQDGRLRASDLLADAFIWWSTTTAEASAGNFYAEVTAEIQACSGRDAAGFGARVSGTNLDNGYTLEVSCDGHYRIRKFTEGKVETLRDWTPSEAIVQGPNVANRMGLLARGGDLTGFVNGVALGPAVQDSALPFGTFALFAGARQTPGLTVIFDDFSLWHLSP